MCYNQRQQSKDKQAAEHSYCEWQQPEQSKLKGGFLKWQF